MRTPLLLAAFCGSLLLLWAGEQVPEEYHVKGAFLLNFAKFVEWPADAFKGPADPIEICILGANPFGPGLALAAGATSVEGRSVSVRLISDASQARGCQMVFVSATERKRVRAVMEAAKGAGVLTVGESEGFIGAGGMIEFRVDQSRVRMEISAEAAKRAGLHISAKLLSLSQSARN